MEAKSSGPVIFAAILLLFSFCTPALGQDPAPHAARKAETFAAPTKPSLDANAVVPESAMALAKDIAAVAGVVIALFGLFKGIVEYQLQGAQKRADFFLKKQQEFFSNTSFNKIRSLLERDDPELTTIPLEDRRAYANFFEEIAVSVNTRLIRNDIAYYMYGYYAMKCDISERFWSDLIKKICFGGCLCHLQKI